jgi:hypothetical protein
MTRSCNFKDRSYLICVGSHKTIFSISVKMLSASRQPHNVPQRSFKVVQPRVQPPQMESPTSHYHQLCACG